MTAAEIAVTIAGALLAVAVNVYFFAPARPRKARAAHPSGAGLVMPGDGPRLVMPGGGSGAPASAGPQEVRIRVRDGYQPRMIEVESGRPVRLVFHREEVAGCSDTVLIPEWKIAQRLPAHQDTVVEFTPREPGEYPFTCGMNMLRGTIVVR